MDRLELLDFGRVGAVLFVAKTTDKDPYVRIGLNPMSTPVDCQDTDTYGAPTVSEFLDEALFPQFTDDPDTPGHIVLASLGGTTRAKRLTTSNVYTQSSSIFFPQGMEFGAKIGTDGLFKVIFLPSLYSAPVGYYPSHIGRPHNGLQTILAFTGPGPEVSPSMVHSGQGRSLHLCH
jgi:hypothetical protein